MADQDAAIAPFIPWDPTHPDVKTTPSGLQYRVVRGGEEGRERPVKRDEVSVMYDGRLTDGTQFDSSYNRGRESSFGVSQVIAGWTEGLQLMSVGDEFVFYIPTDLGYGQSPRPGGVIKPGDDLIFRVELKDIKKAPEPRAVSTQVWDDYTPWDAGRDGITTTPSGVAYIVIESGDADGTPPSGSDVAVVYYEGRFGDNSLTFDSAFQRGKPEMMPVNQLIPGWQEALSLMRPGDRWLVHIPSDQAYGPRGHPGGIPSDMDLNFEMELIDVLPSR